MNKYTITSIDGGTGAIYVRFEYNEHILDHTVFADITDPEAISLAVDIAYSDFTTQIDKLDAAPVLAPNVSELIGTEKLEADVLKELQAQPDLQLAPVEA